MSTIKADTIVASDGTSPVTLTKQSAAKAWVSFDNTGGTPSVNESFNNSSITDTQAGEYGINFVNSFTNNGYSSTGSASGEINWGGIWANHYAQLTSSQCRHYTLINDGTALADFDRNAGNIHGDLA